MNSSLIGKIDKALRYAQERDRIAFNRIGATFHGENGDHSVTLDSGKWHCTCNFFAGWGLCSHTMALEKVLGSMLPESARNQGAEHGAVIA